MQLLAEVMCEVAIQSSHNMICLCCPSGSALDNSDITSELSLYVTNAEASIPEAHVSRDLCHSGNQSPASAPVLPNLKGRLQLPRPLQL